MNVHDELRGYVWPVRGGRAEEVSLLLQGERHDVGVVPGVEERQRVLAKVVEQYPRTRVPSRFAGSKHTVTPEVVKGMYPFLNKVGSPGLPWAAIAPTKGLLCEQHGSLLADAVVEMLDKLDSVELSQIPEAADPQWLVDNGFDDPVRLFVKQEPHTLEKSSEGRHRLISSCSVRSEIVERLLCHVQNEAEIDRWVDCPSKPGIGLSLDEQAKALFSSVSPFLESAAEADVSGWDWSVKWWMFEMEAEARILLCGAAPTSSFARILRNRIWCLARSVFATSDGKLFKQSVPGVMKSGSYLTSSSNSRMRVMVAYLIGASWAIAMGDDSLETWTPNAVERYKSLGIKVKMFRRCGDSFEFCSHRFVDGVAIPLNWAKGLFRLLSAPLDAERVEQFKFEYRHSPRIGDCCATISRAWQEQGKSGFGNGAISC
jgi:hypothetical protein